MPRAFANRIASRTMRAPWPRPRWAGSVNIERRYAAVVPFQFGLGWTCMSQRQPLATGSPPTLHLDSAPLTRVSSDPRILVAVSGASGVEYARRLIEILGDSADVVTTRDAQAVIEIETGLTVKEFAARARSSYGEDNLAAAPASGSSLFRAVVVVPCSGTTLAKIATGIADNLVTRAAAVAIKENRKLILVPRETPVGAIALENMLKLARLGVVIM